MRVLVTGGAGALGSQVVEELRRRGHEPKPASRRFGVDLATGEGLPAAVASAEAIVHCATRPLRPTVVDVGGTRRLAAEVAKAVVMPHLVYISIVGCDANPYPYYRAKAEAEEVLALSGAPATVVRATQFHSLAAAVAGALTLGPVALTLGDMAVQPVDAAWVASRLVDVATGPRPDGLARATDVAGPELLTMAEVASALRRQAGRGAPHVVRLPPVGGTLRAFSARSNIPGPEAQTGGATFSQWLESNRPRGVSAR